jgi:hypothetical protein
MSAQSLLYVNAITAAIPADNQNAADMIMVAAKPHATRLNGAVVAVRGAGIDVVFDCAAYPTVSATGPQDA